MTSALETFGAALMRDARDEAIVVMERRLDGSDRSDDGRSFFEGLPGDASPHELRSRRHVAVHAIDVALHYVLWMIERSEEFDLVAKVRSDERLVSIRELSDGLSGELYTEDGWVARYSRFGEEPP